MGKSKAKRERLKKQQEGGNNPEFIRLEWIRKPQTQVVMNKKAEQRRTLCRRKGGNDGAYLLAQVSYF